jgi:AraC-like DNA-binding protein
MPSTSSADNRLLQGTSWLPVDREPHSSFSFRHLQTRSFPFPFHYHPEVEITYIVKGCGLRIVGETVRRYKDGDLACIGPMLPHAWLSDSRCPATEAYVLRFNADLLNKTFVHFEECSAALGWMQSMDKGIAWQDGVSPVLKKKFENLLHALSPAKRLLGFLDLILSLSDAGKYGLICGDVRRIVVCGNTQQRIGFAVRYLREHFCEEIAQSEIAGRVGMEAAAFSRLFHRTTGQTFQQMLLDLRLEHACRLLSGTQMSVCDICFASGFGNLSNFNKQFLIHRKTTPRDYRRRADYEQS